MSFSGERSGMAAASTGQWFHKNIGRMETEKLLVENREDGSFLIRKSDNVKGAYVLSTIYQQRIHHYRIIPTEDGLLSVQAQEGVEKRPFRSLEDLVDYYSCRGRGLVCPLSRPIAQTNEDEEPPDSDDDHEPEDGNIVSKFLLASLSTLTLNIDSDDGFIDRLKAYLTGDISVDIQSMVSPAPQLTHLKLLLKEDCEIIHKGLDRLMERVDLLQSLFERAGGAKEVGKRSSLSRRRRSRVGETDFDSLSLKLRECSESVQSLETTSFQMLRELSASITGQSRPAGSLGQVAPLVGGLPNNTPSNGEQDDEEEEVMFETKTEGLGHGRKYNIAVNLAEGKLTFKKHGESNSSSYSHQQVLQLIKSRSKEQRLGILLAGQNRKDHNFINMQAREQFCQLIQLIRNRTKAGTGMDQDSVSIFVGTWNMGDASPPGDISSWFRSSGKGKTLPHALAQPHDIYAIGTQECNMNEKEWLSKIRGTLKMVHDLDYEKLASQTLWGIRLVILVKPEHFNKITHVQGSQVRTGIGNALGNKGGVGITFFYGSVSMCFINCHLTSGNEKCSRRNQNYHDILKGMGALKQRKLNQFFLTNQFHHLFFFGDLNYRVDLGATEIVEFAIKEDHGSIFKEDQLRKQMEQKKIFVGFDEPPILFPPTYRFARGRRSLDDYVWVKQKRAGIRLNVPSYCDRVLWCSYPGTIIANTSYGACTDIMTSDHSPLFASFQVGGVKQFVPEPGRGLGSGENQTFIIVDSLKAKIQTSSKTFFFMEIYSNCFEGVQRGSVNDDWIDTQAGYVWPVWCGRDHIFKVPPIVAQLEYLEQQHILILLKSTESDESYAECCLSLRGLFAPKPVNVMKTLIHQGLEIGELDAYIHVTLDHYPKPEEDLYSDINFITADDSSDLDSGRNRAIAHSFINSTSNGVGGRTSSMSDRSIHHVARSSTHSSSSSSSSSFSSFSSLRSHVSQQPLPSPPVPAEKPPPLPISGPPPPLPKRRDLSYRPSSAQDSPHQPPTPVARKPESIAVPGRQESTALLQALSTTSSGDAAGRRGSTPHSGHHQLLLGHLTPPEPAPRTHLPPQLPEGNPPIPLRRNQSLRRVGQNSDDGPSVPPRHSSRDRLELPPPPIPPKSPEPTSLNRAMETSRKLSSVEDLLSLHGLSQYTKKLVENGYDDIHFISEITDTELIEIGVASPTERTRLLKIFSAYAS